MTRIEALWANIVLPSVRDEPGSLRAHPGISISCCRSLARPITDNRSSTVLATLKDAVRAHSNPMQYTAKFAKTIVSISRHRNIPSCSCDPTPRHGMPPQRGQHAVIGNFLCPIFQSCTSIVDNQYTTFGSHELVHKNGYTSHGIPLPSPEIPSNLLFYSPCPRATQNNKRLQLTC